jgi:hypothetical protein
MVGPILTKASIAWHSPVNTSFVQKWLLKKLSPLQNNCIRVNSSAYKATPIQSLEAEIRVSPLGFYLDSLRAQFRLRLERLEVEEVIWLALKKVRQILARIEENRNRGKRPRRRNQRAAKCKNDEDDVGQIGKRGGHRQQGQKEED